MTDGAVDDTASTELGNNSVHLLIGFMIGSLTVGFVAYLVLKAFQNQLSGLGRPQLQGPGQPINIYNMMGGGQLPQQPVPIQPSEIANQMQLNDGTSLDTKNDTVTLSTLTASRVFTAPAKGPMWRVRLHVGGPAGTFGAFSIDSLPSPDGGQSVIIPAGSFTEIKIGARQSISGIAIGGDTFVSYTAAAEVV